LIRNSEIPVYAIDSDGFIGELIPLWLEAGVNACDPIEVAAGNDINEFRKRFGKNMAYRGGVDKREMAKGGIHIEKEMERLAPVIKDGGFVPSCDHGVPSDVSWPNFVLWQKKQVGCLEYAGGGVMRLSHRRKLLYPSFHHFGIPMDCSFFTNLLRYSQI